MEKLKRSLSFRKKKEHVPECSKPHQWQEDERKVREGTCSFQVRYLGCIEVFESRGMQICEEAVKALKAKQNRSVWSRLSIRRKKKKDKGQGEQPPAEGEEEDPQCKGKYQRAILYVSGDALRVVDEISKGLIVDQTIEKVSFCAPDRNHEKGFAYICRDGTTRRWMCHGFLALKESGERLSHAVGCAFAICLEKKQKREKEAVSVQFNDKGTSFTRTGSFRQTTITERLADPQSALVAEPLPVKPVENPYAVQRPHASANLLQRQSSFRGFSKLNESSPFKRQLSVRLSDLPSTLERAQELGSQGSTNGVANGPPPSVSPIAEASPTKENPESIAEMCQALTQGLSALSTGDPFSAKAGANQHTVNAQIAPAPAGNNNTGTKSYHVTVQGRNIALPDPIQHGNPWATPAPNVSGAKVSDADFWLNATASQIGVNPAQANGTPRAAGTAAHGPPMSAGPLATPPRTASQRAPQLQQLRSHSIDTSEMYAWQQQQHRAPTLRELARGPGNVQQFQSQQNGSIGAQPSAAATAAWKAANKTNSSGPDPFDAAWASKAIQGTNPFQQPDTVTKAFEVNL